MARPITDGDRAAVRRLHSQGKGRNEIARAIKRPGSTVSKIAADMDPPLTFERGSEVVAATEARRIDLAARRLDLAHAQQPALRASRLPDAVPQSA